MTDKQDEKIRLLIVDDVAETRENIRKLLQFEPDIVVVGSARTGEEAITQAVETQPDVVLMDINMPDMDGIKATELLLDQVPFVANGQQLQMPAQHLTQPGQRFL